MSTDGRSRVPALDALRGLVMVLMTVDHASAAVNAGRLFTDSAAAYHGAPLPLAQFLTRWVTHLCAPTFVFLAGASLSLSVAGRTRAGARPSAIDWHIVSRGVFIAALDPSWMTLAFFGGYPRFLFQVLYAIGLSLVCMAALRRLPSWALVAAAVVILGGVDTLVGRAFDGPGGGAAQPTWAVAALVTGGRVGKLIFAYPLLPWLSVMMLGWAFGTHVGQEQIPRGDARLRAEPLAAAGLALLGLFAALRGIDAWGNAGLHRVDGSLAQWLHVSKYPPSVTFVALELGCMALLLGAFARLVRSDGSPLGALVALGRNALFYYVLHVHLLTLAAWALGVSGKLGLGATWLAALVVTLGLGRLSLAYGEYKRRHDNLVTRWI